jgi:hypothetical protein
MPAKETKVWWVVYSIATIETNPIIAMRPLRTSEKSLKPKEGFGAGAAGFAGLDFGLEVMELTLKRPLDHKSPD